MNVTTMGVDLAKSVFQLHGVNRQGTPVVRKRLSRVAFRRFMAQLPPCVIGMEVSGGANDWCRTLQGFGHTVRLMSPQFGKASVKTNKNDFNDAEAIGEAVHRPTMRFVPPKPVAQQDVQNIHRVRQRLIGARTAVVNQIRGLLAEDGVLLPKHGGSVRRHLPRLVDEATTELTSLGREAFRVL